MKLPCFAVILIAATALADDQLRDVQTELKRQGFYYGEVTGADSADTSSAIRRYQIRNALPVTGKLNDETLDALGIASSKPKEAVEPKKDGQLNPPAPRNTAKQDLLKAPVPGLSPDEPRPMPPQRAQPPVDYRRPNDQAVVTPPSRIPAPVDNQGYSAFFSGTPYANAPQEVQFDIMRKAQKELRRQGFYTGEADGVPGEYTSKAVNAYQDRMRLPRTGRLDLQTLADLNLLPGRGSEAPPMRPFTNPNRRRDHSVDYNGMR